MEEVRFVYQNASFSFQNKDAFKVEVFNENFFTNLNKFNFSFELLENGKVVEKGDLNLDVKPQNNQVFTLPIKTDVTGNSKEYFSIF